MSMEYLTSGNEIVDAMGSINISGNIILAIWYKTITKENGKPYLLAIVILADIVYWYRPSEVRNQGTGHILGWKKKFSEDILRQSYQYYADLFGESKKTVKTAMDKLERLQVIRREFRTVSYGDGLVCNNLMYVELKPDMLYRLTFPEEIPAMNGENNSYADVSDVKMGGRLPTKSDTPIEISGGVSQMGYRYLQNGIQVMTKRITVSLRNRIQVYPKTERQIHILLQILLTENLIISIKLTVKLKKRLMRWRMSTHTLKSSRRTLNTITT